MAEAAVRLHCRHWREGRAAAPDGSNIAEYFAGNSRGVADGQLAVP